ncbi:MAG: universal stress protein [Acidimicrobiia bacterium]|nr:universal stress protein [Acidimicrobiia bacterium]
MIGVIVAVVVWLLCGAGIALVIARLGHAPRLWFGLAFLGPLLALLALSQHTDDGAAVDARTLSTGEPGAGHADVLVGIDGSPESRAAVDEVVGLLGPALGRLVLAAVIDVETVQYPDTPKAPRERAPSGP